MNYLALSVAMYDSYKLSTASQGRSCTMCILLYCKTLYLDSIFISRFSIFSESLILFTVHITVQFENEVQNLPEIKARFFHQVQGVIHGTSL